MLPVIQFTNINDFISDTQQCPIIYQEMLDLRVGGNSGIGLAVWQTATVIRAIVTDNAGNLNHISSCAIEHGKPFETIHGNSFPGYARKEEQLKANGLQNDEVILYVLRESYRARSEIRQGVIDTADTKILFASFDWKSEVTKEE